MSRNAREMTEEWLDLTAMAASGGVDRQNTAAFGLPLSLVGDKSPVVWHRMALVAACSPNWIRRQRMAPVRAISQCRSLRRGLDKPPVWATAYFESYVSIEGPVGPVQPTPARRTCDPRADRAYPWRAWCRRRALLPAPSQGAKNDPLQKPSALGRWHGTVQVSSILRWVCRIRYMPCKCTPCIHRTSFSTCYGIADIRLGKHVYSRRSLHYRLCRYQPIERRESDPDRY